MMIRQKKRYSAGSLVLTAAIFGIVGFESGSSGASGSEQTRAKAPPNIVFIFSDDHAYQAISAYNDLRRLIDTPHIDRLAKGGDAF